VTFDLLSCKLAHRLLMPWGALKQILVLLHFLSSS